MKEFREFVELVIAMRSAQKSADTFGIDSMTEKRDMINIATQLEKTVDRRIKQLEFGREFGYTISLTESGEALLNRKKSDKTTF